MSEVTIIEADVEQSRDNPDYESLPTHSLYVHLIAGAAAGTMEHCVMYPIDSVKTRVQSLCPCPEKGGRTPVHSLLTLHPEIPSAVCKSDSNPQQEAKSTAAGEPLKCWQVDDVFQFDNVGFTKPHNGVKYLICADCEAGPIGYQDPESKRSYVLLDRVAHGKTADG